MSESRDLPPALHALYLFRQIGDQVGARISADHPDMTPNEINLLLHLATPKRMKDLAEIMVCQPSNMTPLVARCEKAGWVKRIRSKEDARIVHVVLSEDGTRLRAMLVEEISAHIEKVSGIGPATFEKILQLTFAEKR